MDLKKLIILGAAIAGVVLFVQFFKSTDERAFHDYAKDRVQKTFDSLKSGKIADQQDAIGYWRIGHPEPATEGALNSFEKFLAEKQLTLRVGSYQYVSSEVVDGEDQVNRSVRLVCMVDGKRLTLTVRQGHALDWA
jgi:hypothetical protein